MKIKNKYVSAFTIMELMVALVLFVTIISIGILLWGNVSRGLNKIQNDSEVFYEYISLITVLEKDLNQAASISSSGIILELTNDLNEITYSFYPDSVIRTINTTITKFNLKTLNYQLSYYKQTDAINGIDLQFKLHGKEINCNIYNSIAGRSLIKTQLENGN